MPIKNVYLMRHGATELNGCYVGSTDIALSASGEAQVQRTASTLKLAKISQVFCSPMIRCRQTLQLLELESQVSYDPLLREIDFGKWERKTFNEIVKADKTLVDSWAEGSEDFTFPEGESLLNFRARVSSFTKKLYESKEQEILIVCHGGVIRHLICELLGLISDKYIVFQVLPGTFSSLQLHSEGGVLTGFNISG